ncbi:MAG: PQQ-binding-like beta-propeller repeat protein [bacterium]|nr:PQQ-binding-like beta-propeller repeat protein [bacterium]
MKKVIFHLYMLLLMFASSEIYSQNYTNWTTVGGNSNRTGSAPESYGSSFGIQKTFIAPATIWGMPIFTYGNKFVTTRYTSLNPLRALVCAFQFNSVNPLWTYGQNSGVNIIMGYNNNKIYVRDFQQNGVDSIFALNETNGSVIWKSRFTVERGIIWTAVFAANGDLIVPGSGTKRIMRINHTNGDTVWTNSRIIPNTGAESMCVNGNTLYAWEGSITTPKKILAIDINTGVVKYSSGDLPGDGDQEIPFTVSETGVIYCIRDGGLMYALKDNGTGITELWSRTVSHPVGTYTQIAVGKDSTVYIPFGKKIIRLDPANGSTINESIDLVSNGSINPRFALNKLGNVFVSNGADQPSEGKFFTFDNDLQQIGTGQPFAFNYYCGPAFGNEELNPYYLFTGAGTEIKSWYVFIDNIVSENSSPGNFELKQNYPNPFNPGTIINYELRPSREAVSGNFVTIKVFDIMGKEIAVLVDQKQTAGKHSVRFEGSNYSSGVYFYSLMVDGILIRTKEMTLVR